MSQKRNCKQKRRGHLLDFRFSTGSLHKRKQEQATSRGVDWRCASAYLRSLPPCQLSCAILVTAASMTAKETEWLSDFAAPVAATPRKPASNRGQHQLPTAARTHAGRRSEVISQSTPAFARVAIFCRSVDMAWGITTA